MPCLFSLSYPSQVVDFSVCLGFLLVVKMEWQLPSSLYADPEILMFKDFLWSMFSHGNRQIRKHNDFYFDPAQFSRLGTRVAQPELPSPTLTVDAILK